jgi:Mg-chelatase subunit ChlD
MVAMLGAVLWPMLALVPAQGDAIGRAFSDWLGGVREGIAHYDHSVLGPLLTRGSLNDGRLVLALLEMRPPDAAAAARAAELKARVLQDLDGADCPPGIQVALFERLLVAPTGEPPARTHSEPELAAAILRLLPDWHDQRFVPLIESFCRGTQPSPAAAAAEALGRCRAERAAVTIAEAVCRLPEPAQVREAGRHLARLLGAPATPVAEGWQAVDALVGELSRESPVRRREALLALLAGIADWRAVPGLVTELARTWDAVHGGETPTETSFYLAALRETLVAITGCAAPASRLDVWRQVAASARGRRPTLAEVRGGSSHFYGLPVRGRRVVFVLDVSGSMKQALGAETRLDRAKRELLTAVAELDPETEFAVVVFSDVVLRLDGGFARRGPKRDAALRSLLDHTVPFGSTDMGPALEAALRGKVFATQTAERRSVDEVFLLSDGMPRGNPLELIEEVGRWNVARAARIHAIHCGSGDDSASNVGRIPHGKALGPLSFMQRLAAENGGSFVIVGK